MTDQVELNGWDTAFAIKYSDVNESIRNKWDDVNSAAKVVDYTVETHAIKGCNLSPWQLEVGGDGMIAFLQIPVTSGELVDNVTNVHYLDLSGAVVHVEIDLRFVPDPVRPQASMLRANDQNSNVTSCRSIDIPDNRGGIIHTSIAKLIFGKWLKANLANFNHVFHEVNLSERIDSDNKWSWITPTAVGYSVTDSGSMDSSVFAVLTKTTGTAPVFSQVSPRAIPQLANGALADAGFTISGQNFVQQMLLIGAAVQFQMDETVTQYSIESQPEEWRQAVEAWAHRNFEIGNDGLSVQNRRAMLFNRYQDGDKLRELHIGERQFSLSIDYQKVKLELIGLKFEFSSGIWVHMDYTQYFEMGIETKDGKKIFKMNPSGDADIGVTVVKSRAVVATEIITSLSIAIAAALLGGFLGEGVQASQTLTQSQLQAGLEGSAETGTAITLQTSNQTLTDVTSQASSQAVSDLTANTTAGAFAGFFTRFGPKIGAVVGALFFEAIALIPEYLTAAAENKYESIPDAADFMNRCIQYHTWPGQKAEYELAGVSLSTSFQLALSKIPRAQPE